jgi:pimeloyl-ACP methyl ester carboxylesterase
MIYRDDVISVRGRHVRLLRGGSGRPLLYLHDPWSYAWQPVHDHLAARHDVVFPIHPGFEGTDGLDEMDRMEDLVFHYLDLLDVLRLEQPILLGVSLGGWLAAEFAVRHAGMLRALILVDAMGLRVSTAPATDLFQLTPGQARAALFADPSLALAQTLVPDAPPQESITAMLKARQAFARFAWQFPDNPKLTSYLYRVKTPTLIVWGERDGVLPVSHGQAYQAEIAEAELALMPACAHLPQLEQPEAFAATVLKYLQRAGASG